MDNNKRQTTLVRNIVLFYIGLHSSFALAASDVAKEEVTPPAAEGALSVTSITPLTNSASKVSPAGPQVPPSNAPGSAAQPVNSGPPAADSTNVLPVNSGPKMAP